MKISGMFAVYILKHNFYDQSYISTSIIVHFSVFMCVLFIVLFRYIW